MMSLRGVAVSRTHLGFNADFDDSASDGEEVADDKKDVPAVNELHPVGPAHLTVQGLLEELYKLLKNTEAKRGLEKLEELEVHWLNHVQSLHTFSHSELSSSHCSYLLQYDASQYGASTEHK